MQPKFIELPEKKVVGLGTKFISIMSPDKNNMTVIPKLWEQVMQQKDKINNRMDNSWFGVVEQLRDSEKSHKDEMYYIAAAEVVEIDSVPAGMISRVIPAGKYASFTHIGKLDGLGKTMNFIYGDWLPKSGVQLRHAPHLELYDRRFIPDSDKSEFDILLPVR